ncbi:MAG TPA: PAS domain S-box protein [Steroidobacteraceae bacterium]|jgi:PAS domain S-box-containing protein|nr:PAS domain S-box protein [Steroidobacteraceae bacterium]
MTDRRLDPSDAPKGHVEPKLQLSEERFHLLLDSVSGYALFMMDPSGIISSWNAGAERLKGYRSEEIIGRHFSCFYTPEDIARGHPAFELSQAVEQGKYEEEGWRVRKDGSRFFAHVLISAMRGGNGEAVGFVKLTRDVSATRELNEALRTQAKILDLANDAICVRDMDDRITYWNQAAGRVYGWTAEEALGRVTHELLKTSFPKPFLAIAEEVRLQGRWEGELGHTRRDGARLVVESRWTVMVDDNGQPSGVIEVNHDITERERLAVALKATNLELQKALEAKDAFLAMMSHELRTPLNGIIGFSELLYRGRPGPLNEQQREFVGDVLESGNHLLTLINDILDLSKIGAGKMELRLSDFSIKASVRQVCSAVQPLADKKRIVITQHLEAAPESVVLDETRFRQVVWNLLSNAIKFTESGGEIAVDAGCASDGRFTVTVRDSGIGIAPENMHRLFKSFEQLDDGLNRRYEGTGLGLALTRSLVEMQGGTIAATSQKGVGSVFTVELPNKLEDPLGI